MTKINIGYLHSSKILTSEQELFLKIAKENNKLRIFFVKQVPTENGWYMEKWPIESLLE